LAKLPDTTDVHNNLMLGYHTGVEVNIIQERMWMLSNLMENKVAKISIATVLIVLLGGAWVYMDYLNKQDEVIASQMQLEMAQMRVDGKSRENAAKKAAEAKVNLETQIRNNLASCQTAAEKMHNDTLRVLEKTLPKKRGTAVVPQNILDEFAQILAATKTECQQGHDALMQKVPQ
jgi:hypothetical protein